MVIVHLAGLFWPRDFCTSGPGFFGRENRRFGFDNLAFPALAFMGFAFKGLALIALALVELAFTDLSFVDLTFEVFIFAFTTLAFFAMFASSPSYVFFPSI